MYYKTKIKDIVRIPPYKFEEPRKKVAIEILNKTYEGRLDKKLGLLICVNVMVLHTMMSHSKPSSLNQSNMKSSMVK